MLGHGRGAAGGEPALGAAEVSSEVAAGGHAPPALQASVTRRIVDCLKSGNGVVDNFRTNFIFYN